MLWGLLALLSVLPYVFAPLPPQADLLSHIGRYHIMAFGDQSEFLRRYYSFHWTLIGNLGQDLPAYPLTLWLGAERAGVILAALIPPATVLGIRQLSIAVHCRVEPASLFALPFVYSFPFLFGFVNYCMGIALCLWVVAAWYHWRTRGWLWRAVVFLGLSSLVWLVHMAVWAVLIVAVGSIELANLLKERGWQPARIAVRVFCRVLPLAVVPVAMTLFWRTGVSDTPETPLPSLLLKSRWLAFVLRDQSTLFDLGSLALIAGVFLLLIYRRYRFEAGLGLTALILFILFGVMPPEVLGSYFADLRLLPPFAIFTWVALRTAKGGDRWQGVLVGVALALFIARIGVTMIGWMERSAALTADLKALDHVERGARIAALAPVRMFESWENSGVSHLPSLAIIRREAFVNTEWDNDGAQLMRPIYNAGRDFNSDKSAKLRMRPTGDGRTLEQFMTDLPRDRFDYIWLFKTDLSEHQKHGLELKFRNNESVLYAIRHDGRHDGKADAGIAQ